MKRSTIPPHIFKEATASHLGTPLRGYRDMWPFMGGIIGLLFLLILGSLGVLHFLSAHDFTREIDFGVFCVIISIFVFSSLRSAWLDRNKRLYLCSDGLLFRDGSYVETIRWDEVEEVKLDGNINRGHTLLLLTRDASPFRISRSSWQFTYGDNEFWNAIEDALLPYLLPQALERFEYNKELIFDASRFGITCIHKHHIKHDGCVRQMYELEDVRANAGRLWFKQKGKWELQRGHVANARLCAALIRYAREQQARQLA